MAKWVESKKLQKALDDDFVYVKVDGKKVVQFPEHPAKIRHLMEKKGTPDKKGKE